MGTLASRIRTCSNALPAAVAFFTNHGFEHVLSNCEARAVLRECGIMEPSPAKLMVKKSLHTPMLDPSPLSKGMVKPSKNSSKKAERRAAREAVIAARDNTHDGRKASREGSTKAERRAARETGGGGSQPRPHPKLAVVPRVSTGAVWCGAWNLGS